MEGHAAGTLSSAAAHAQDMCTAALFPPLTLEALMLRCCLLVLAAAAALAAYSWGPLAWAEAHRFLILFRHVLMESPSASMQYECGHSLAMLCIVPSFAL
jgi:hypothetical protein